MQCRTALLRHSRQRRRRVKGLARKYRGRTVGDARQVTHHHAEAVVQGHRNAQSVVLRQAHAIADELAVVEDIEMGESGTLGVAGSTAGELYIDRISWRQRLRPLPQCPAVCTDTAGTDRGKIEHARRAVRPHPDHPLQVRQAL